MKRLLSVLEYIILLITLVLAVDAFISLKLTCGSPYYGQAAYQGAEKSCSVVSGFVFPAIIFAFEHLTSEGIIAAFTVILAISTIGLWIVTWQSGERQSDDMAAMREIAEKQWNITTLQADTQKKQHAVGRMQFIAEHRPRLIIRSITLEIPSGQRREYPFEAGKIVQGSLVVVNRGETEARIVSSCYRFFWATNGLPMEPPLGENVFPLFEGDVPPIGGKESRLLPVKSAHPFPQGIVGPHVGARNIYLMGLIRYTDISSPPKERFMGFCRVYIPPDQYHAQGHFRPIENPDYEFED